MKIAQLVPSLLPTGPVNVALDLTSMLRQKGHEVQVFYFDEKPGGRQLPGSLKISFWDAEPLRKFDIVHSHALRPDAYVWKNARHLPPAVSTLHNYVYEDLRYRYGKLTAEVFTRLWNRFCNKHKANVVLSEDMKTYYASFWKNQQLAVVPNSRQIDLTASPAREQEIKDLAGGRKVAGSISHITSRKGLDQALDFLKMNPDWIFVHIGGGDLKLLRDQAHSRGVTERLHCLGHKDLPWQYARAFDVFVLPSRSEGFPLSLIEAIQVEVPVVTSDIPVFREIFSKEEICRFQLDDPSSLNDAIHTALKNKTSLVESACRRFQADYSPEVIVEKHLKLYSQVL